jgi:hypothetical protein
MFPMRRLLSIATFVFLLALVPAWAQMRGGGRGSFGGHGGFAGHGSFGGHMGGSHVFGGMPSGRGFSGPHFQSRGFGRGSSFHQPNFFRGDRFRGDRFRGDRFRGDRFRHHRFHDFDFDDFANCFGCGWGAWPWWNAGFWDPWWWDSHSSYDEDHERELQLANEMNARSLDEQRARRQEDQDLYARSDPPPQAREEAPEAPTPATVLVFRDQHKQEIQNYAIVGQTLWTFAPRHTQKIPLSDLDLPATTKANDERGVDFRVPGDGEGQ